jgi:gliding motility-associated-like protein
MVKYITFFALFFLFTFQSKASHIVGGEVYYDTVQQAPNGDMIYRFTFELFRDCNTTVSFPIANFHYTVFNDLGVVVSEGTIPFDTADELALVYDDPCVVVPDDRCIEAAIYSINDTLPIVPGDYTIAYQVGNWDNNYINFIDPGTEGMTIMATIPGTNKVSVPNNSARFEDYPQIVFCLNTGLTIDNSIIEADGDSLAFKLCDPLALHNTTINPQPETAPPYLSIPWEVGFNAANPFGNTAPTNMDAVTGDFTVVPDLLGNFVARFCVEEWRGGVLINNHSRTFGYTIVECDIDVPFTVETAAGNTGVLEGCGNIQFYINRSDTVGDLTIYVGSTGGAQEGYNYEDLPDSLIIPEGLENDTVSIGTLFQSSVDEGLTGEMFLYYVDPCTGENDTIFSAFTLIDYIPMELEIIDSVNICSDLDEVYMLTPSLFTGGVGPYFYQWYNESLNYPNSDTIYVDANTLNSNLNLITVQIYDGCGNEIDALVEIYEQCRVVAPNVITPNNDGINDFFVLKNLEDYDRLELQVFNRWGNLIYESDDYQNDWNGLNLNSEQITEGVYFYTATPIGDKYDYEHKSDERLMHGYIHVFRGQK